MGVEWDVESAAAGAERPGVKGSSISQESRRGGIA